MKEFLYGCLLGWFLVALTWAAFGEERRVEVSGDRADYAVEGGGAVFSGNVVLAAGGLTVYAAELGVRREAAGNVYTASGAPLSVFCGDCGAEEVRAVVGESLQYSEAGGGEMRGGLTVCIGADCARGELRADSGEWRRADNTLILRGAAGAPLSAELLIKTGQPPVSVRAESAEYQFDSGDLQLAGNAKIWRDSGEIVGETIRFNTRTGALEAAGGGGEDDRVKATFE